MATGVQPQTLGMTPPPQVCGALQLEPQATVCPQLLGTLPHLRPPAQVTAGASGRHPQIPATPPPPQLSPVPEQALEHWTVWPQLLTVGPHLPPAQVVACGSSVHALQTPVSLSQPNEHAMSAPH